MRARVLIATALAALTVTGVAWARTSHAKLWTSSDGAIACGYKIHPAKVPASELLCVSALIPAPRGATGPGDDGFVQLSKVGSPQRLRLSQDSFIKSTATALKKNTTWTGLGVTCTVGTTSVRCVNGSGHGFKITASAYRAF
jgi:hypothetical protein